MLPNSGTLPPKFVSYFFVENGFTLPDLRTVSGGTGVTRSASKNRRIYKAGHPFCSKPRRIPSKRFTGCEFNIDLGHRALLQSV